MFLIGNILSALSRKPDKESKCPIFIHFKVSFIIFVKSVSFQVKKNKFYIMLGCYLR